MKKQKESDKTKLKTTLAQLKQYQQLGTMSEIQKCFDVLEKYVEIGSVDEFKSLSSFVEKYGGKPRIMKTAIKASSLQNKYLIFQYLCEEDPQLKEKYKKLKALTKVPRNWKERLPQYKSVKTILK